MSTVEISTPHSKHQVLEKKLTSLGLYVTAREAYEMWKADPERIKVLDVRTNTEYALNGHAEMAANVPLVFPSYKWDIDKGDYTIVLNKDFVASVTRRFKLEDTILAMCRSGTRSAIAVNVLAKAGFTKVYNVIDGFDGIRWMIPKASGMECEDGTAGRTPPLHGLTSLTPHWSGFHLMRSGKFCAIPWSDDLDQHLLTIQTASGSVN